MASEAGSLRGTPDGDGQTISRLTRNGSDASTDGLVGTHDSSGGIQQLTIQNAAVTGSDERGV